MPDQREQALAVPIVFGILIRGGQVLMIKRAFEPYQGTITVPGGHKRPGESLRRACIREMAEETGYTLNSLKLAGVMEVNSSGDSRDFLCFYFISGDFGGKMASGSEGDVFWVGLNEAPHLAKAHPAFKALAPVLLCNRGFFEARAMVDEDGEGEYVILEDC